MPLIFLIMSLCPVGALTTSKNIPKNASERISGELAGTSKISQVLILNWKIAPAHVQREPFGNKLEFPELSFPMAGKELQGLEMWLMASTNISDFRALRSCCNLKIKNFSSSAEKLECHGHLPRGILC